MSRSLGVAAVGVAVAAAMLAGGYYAGRSTANSEASPATGIQDRAAIESIVREYLIANPDVMVEVQTALTEQQEARQQQAAQTAISTSREQIFNLASDGIAGNPTGEITMVEFYDYNCGYCKRALPDVTALIEDNPDLRVVLKEFPILGPDSQRAHQVSLAFQRLSPEKWPEFHDSLMASSGRASEQTAVDLARSLGADEAALRKEMENPEIAEQVRGTYKLAEMLNITGTPAFVIGDQVVYGAIGKDALQEKIIEVRDEMDGS
jgi:protein-disulfide isomerase